MSNPCGTAISLGAARTIVVRALAHARSSDFPPMTVAVLDAAGRLVAFAGEDGSSLLRERIARGKAHGALNMGVGSRSLAARAASNPAFVNSLVSLAEGNLFMAHRTGFTAHSLWQMLNENGFASVIGMAITRPWPRARPATEPTCSACPPFTRMAGRCRLRSRWPCSSRRTRHRTPSSP